MKEAEHQLDALAQQNPATQRLLTIPGISLLMPTALVGFIGYVKRFRSGRHFASYLGLVPKSLLHKACDSLGAAAHRPSIDTLGNPSESKN